MIQRAFRYRLSPTPEQAELFEQFAGVTRLVYNLALEQRRVFWRQYRAANDGHLNYISQGRELTKLRAEIDWIAAVPSTPLTQALRDLDRAYAAYFSGRAGPPTPRRKGVNDRFRFKAREFGTKRLNRKWSAVRVPKVGWVKFRNTRDAEGRCVNMTIAKVGAEWFVSFAHEIERDIPANDLPAIGIDRGIANTLALSNGEMLSTPDCVILERRRRKAQRILARRLRGSGRYRKQLRRVGRISARLARTRSDWQHKTSFRLAQHFGTVCVENLRIAAMTVAGRGKRGLNRSILEQGWGGFERALVYKLEERGGTLVKVNPAYTSQECSACGVIDKRARESQARFACRECGFAAHADTNAAINILRRGTALMRVEDAGCGSDEARTINLAA